ncbi:hypothetical protein PGTUg99_024650 [Puccinia graminis f. sp. tritici]|uniref:Uncharacterized protein n=1 Tax=Puccinia graminis f. sp. tritici TaxID=56615 RepID=A0A5B0S5U7_PUCGR|nr:hypothetical protein PGTUg99_024650 [Puccinia graminis f. sp. tritici]
MNTPARSRDNAQATNNPNSRHSVVTRLLRSPVSSGGLRNPRCGTKSAKRL